MPKPKTFRKAKKWEVRCEICRYYRKLRWARAQGYCVLVDGNTPAVGKNGTCDSAELPQQKEPAHA